MDCQKTRPFYNSAILLRRLYEITRIHHRRSTECHYLLVQLFLLMEWPLVKFFLWTLLFILIRENKCYMEEERIGLLEFKGFLKSNIKNTNFLLSWVNKAKSECCNGEGLGVMPSKVMWLSSLSTICGNLRILPVITSMLG